MIPGDIVFTRTSFNWRKPASYFGLLIRIGAFIRYGNSPYNWANHVAIVVDPNGTIVEALGRGVCLTHIKNYEGVEELAVVNPFEGAPVPALLETYDRIQIVERALRQVGKRYGFLSILSLAVTMLTGSKFVLDIDRSWICSELAAYCLGAADIDLALAYARTSPADLCRFFEAPRPSLSDPPIDINTEEV